MSEPLLVKNNSDEQNFNPDFESETIPHLDALYNFAFKITGNSRYADNLTKETYKKAFDFRKNLDPATNIKEWLFRIMRNTFTASYSKNNKPLDKEDFEEIERSYESIKPSSSNSIFFDKTVYDKLSEKEISSLISSLPEDLRIVIIRRDFEGYSYEEIAEFVDVPVGVVRSRLHRARKMLFTKLYNYANDKGYLKGYEKE